MNRHHYALWDRCQDFVGDVCRGRDASHGLAHMQRVTEQALLLYLMKGEVDADVRNCTLYRLILVGMLHDVADHKYDKDGTLFDRVEKFVATEVGCLLETAKVDDAHLGPSATGRLQQLGATELQGIVRTCLRAISYSKENVLGMRWFERELPQDWIVVRDYVSDSDKLEAIGTDGLFRCYEYTCSRYKEAAKVAKGQTIAQVGMMDMSAQEKLCRLQARLLRDVASHFEEKLRRIYTDFIVSPEGKSLGLPRHRAMEDLLQQWMEEGPPPVTLYWRDAASEYAEPSNEATPFPNS